jgi:CRISPR/Cas system-associated endonuclease Cas3-HD
MSKNNSLSNLTKTILKNISGRSKDIVEKRFGLFSDKEYTLHSIGTTLKVTRERIRQIEKEALRTLKKAKTPKEFNQFISEVKKILKTNGGFCEQDFLFTLLKKKYDEKNIDKLFIFLATLDDTIIQVEKNNSCKTY